MRGLAFAATGAPSNLPSPLTSFVGRTREVSRLHRLLESERLVTLTGPGGIGKTRLAVEAARRATSAYPDGVWFIDLAAARQPDQVASKIGLVLGQREEAGRDLVESLASTLHDSEVLLVLDNCEHLVESCATVAGRLLEACGSLRILATSRERLGVPGEMVWSVPALAVPEPTAVRAPERIIDVESVRLFFDRAGHFDSDLDRHGHALAVAAICQRLDGLPLAIELAAARARVLSPGEIAERLDDRLGLLVGGSRLVSERHQTLRATLEWSYELLSPAEQAVLRRLSSFAGGFSLESATAVGAGADIAIAEVLDLITSLVDKSLLNVGKSGPRVRYRMLQTIGEFATDRLAQSGESAAIGERHAEHFCRLAEEAEPWLRSAEQAPWLDRLESEHENLRAALSWCSAEDHSEMGVRLACALWRFWYVRGHFAEGRRWLDLLLGRDHSSANATRANALRGTAVMARVQGDYADARRWNEAALAMFREIGDRTGTAMTLNSLGTLACAIGDLAAAEALIGGECLDLYRKLKDDRGIATCTNNLALVARARGDHAEVEKLCAVSLGMYRRVGFQEGVAASLLNLGFATIQLERYEEARRYAIESLTIFRDLGYREGVAEAMEALAYLAVAQNRDQRAARLFGASAGLRELIAAPIPFPHERREYEAAVALSCNRMSEPAFRSEWSLGRAMSMEDGLAYSMDDAGLAGSARPGGLTRRELEIGRLVAQGLKDREIATRLYISPRTVGKHVEHIRDKLDLRSRSELGAWMMRSAVLTQDSA